jgi:hypothetical protein
MFFEPLPPPPEEPERERRAQPPWVEKPRGIMPGGVPLELVLAREPKLAVVLCRLGACPDGFEADLIVLGSEELDEEVSGALFGMHTPRRRRGQRVDPASAVRFGVQYADGSKAELERNWHGRESRPEGPVIRTRGGQGNDGEWLQRLWFWPLPPPGTVTFALEWPSQGIELRLHEVDAAPIREAAERALAPMPMRDLADGPAYTTHAMRPQAGE